MEYDYPHHWHAWWPSRLIVEVIMSHRQFNVNYTVQGWPISDDEKSQKRENWQEGCMCHGWHSAPVPRLTGQRSRSPGRSGWMFKSPLSGGGGILWRPHYRLHSLLKIIYLCVNVVYGYWDRRADVKGVTPLPCLGVLVAREKMRSSECFLLVGDRKGIRPQNLCFSSSLFNRQDNKNGQGTARSTSWATPSVYQKQNDGEPGQTAGWSCRHYEGHRPDSLQGSRWGDARILLMFQTV